MSQPTLGALKTDDEREPQPAALTKAAAEKRCVDCGSADDLAKDYVGDWICASCFGDPELSRPGQEVGDPAEITYAERLRAAVVYSDEIKDIPAPAPLVAGMLDLDTLALVYGPSGSSKTFVGLDLALSVGTKTWWHGRKVDGGPVLYIVAEGLGGIGARVDAWQHKRQIWNCGETYWLPMAVSLLHAVSVDGLVELVRDLRPRLVVIDTVARSMVGGDENTAKDMGAAVESAERLRRACSGCILLVHHSGEDEAAGARGSSALRAAVSTEIECRHVDGVTTLKQTKQREHETAEPLRLALVPVRESCAFEQYCGDDASLSKGALELLAELAAIADAEGVSASVWRVSSGVADRSFYRRSKALVDLGYCHKVGAKAQARYTVSDLGKQALGQ